MLKRRALKKEALYIKKMRKLKGVSHSIDLNAYNIEHGQYIPWVIKKNKFSGQIGEESSCFEVAFSELALLFMGPGVTVPTVLMVEGHGNTVKVAGVASQHICFHVQQHMDAAHPFYAFDVAAWCYTPIQMPKPDIHPLSQLEEVKKSILFLDKMPVDFFSVLMQKHQQGELVVDMDALASLITNAYVLEEDDLHKANIGFYISDITDEHGQAKKKFTFFKIDHDLMFMDDIMSFKDMRLANIFYHQDSFKISVRDLERLPHLYDSGNHYWPTQKRLIVDVNKAYTGSAERHAFAALNQNLEFNRAKWRYLLKSALMPTELIEQALTIHLDPERQRDKLNMINNSVWRRLGELRQALLSSQQWIDYLSQEGAQAFEQIHQEIAAYSTQAGLSTQKQTDLLHQLKDNFNALCQCTQSNELSAVQKSIILDNYSYLPSSSTFSSAYSDDIAFALTQLKQRPQIDAKKFQLACIAENLINNLSERTQFQEARASLQQVKHEYLKTQSVKTMNDFEALADRIRAAHLPLKQQKNQLLAAFREMSLPLGVLLSLKKELQKKEPLSPSLKFIKQLRSELWIVRKIFGTYGRTSTSSLMLEHIDAQIKHHQATHSRFFSVLDERTDLDDYHTLKSKCNSPGTSS